MKKRNLNSKQLRLMSVGLLASSAVLSVADSAPIVAKEKDNQDVQGEDEQEAVTILSSTTEETETSKESIPSETIGTSTSSEESTDTTEGSTEETEDSSATDSTSSTTDSTSSTTESNTSESNSTTQTSTSETNSSSSSTSSSSTSTSTTTSKPKPVKPKPTNPSQPSQSNRPVWAGSVQGPVQPTTPKYPVTGNTGQTVGNGSNETISVSPNLTTKAFINVIGEDAREVAGTNDLYASVMIAQAILESASGNSTLAAAPNYNLFGIKGNYKGASANFLTSEDNGSGSMYTIRSDFRKYPSYKESLEDYVKLLRGGTDFNNDFYSGTWKSNTKSHKDATSFLTGKYATDTSYAGKLNGLIEAYDLTKYDELKDTTNDKKTDKDKISSTLDKKVTKKDAKQEENIEFVTHIVKKGESLKSISELYNISTLAILEKNQLDRRMLFIGQTLKIPKQETTTNEIRKEEVVDRSFEMAQKLSMAFSGRNSKTADSDRTKESNKSESSTTTSSISTDSNTSNSNLIESSSVRSSSLDSSTSESSVYTDTTDSSISSSSMIDTEESSTTDTSRKNSIKSNTISSNSKDASSTTSSSGKDTSSSTSSRKSSNTRKSTNSSEKETADSSSDIKVSATRTKTKHTYEVKEGDTLASISKKTGVSIWSLKEWNDLDQYFLTEGQLLVLSPVYNLDA